MTVSSTTARKTFTGDGATTSFATSPMVFFAAADLTVYVVTTATGAATTLTLNTHYTVSGGSGSTGTVSLAGGASPYGAPSAAQTVVIVRELDRVQEVDFVDNEASDAEVQEDALDKLTMMIQEIDARVARSLTLADSDVSSATATLPTPEASTLLGWNSAGTGLQNYEAGDIAPDILVSTFMETVLDDADADAVIETLADSMTAETNVNLGADYVPFSDVSANDGRKALVADAVPIRAVSGRLTLASGTPVMTSDDTGNTTIYFTPYNGDVIPIYDGTRMVPTIFTELSQATTDNTKSPAAVANNSNYDLFVWNDAGTIRCTRGPAWTSDTARGTGAGTTELELVKGIYVNKVAITNGPAAQRGTYVGSVRSNGTATIDWKLGGTASGGSEIFAGVWNAYNQVDFIGYGHDSAAGYTYQSTTVRASNNSTANRVSYIIGLPGTRIDVSRVQYVLENASFEYPVISFGYDVTNAIDADTEYGLAGWNSGIQIGGTYRAALSKTAIGFHFIQAVERNSAATAAVSYSTIDGVTYANYTICARWRG